MTELTITTPEIQEYAQASTTPDTDGLTRIADQTMATMEMPQMLSGMSVGRLLEVLAFTTGAQRVLEIGTFTGYSALSMISGMPEDGKLVTCEYDPEIAKVAQAHFDAHSAGDRIELKTGPALETLKDLDGPFDLVFIDAAKTEYSSYLQAVLPMLAPHGLIVVDNTLWSGRVLDPAGQDEDTRALASFNEEIAANPDLRVVLLTVRDGVSLICRRA